MSGDTLRDQRSEVDWNDPDVQGAMAEQAHQAMAAYAATHDLHGPPGSNATDAQVISAVNAYIAAHPPAAGSAATVTIGNVTTGSPGSSVTVTNSGTSSAAVLDIAIPRGAVGDPGAVALPNITLGETAVIAISAGFRKLTVACAGALTTDKIAVFPSSATPAGYAIHDTVCTSNGNLQVTLSVPLIALGASYSITCRVLALGR